MTTRSLAELELEITQRAEQTDKERLAEVEKHAKELAEFQMKEQAEIVAANARSKAVEEHVEQQKRNKAIAEGIAKQTETASRVRLEAEQNAKDEELRHRKEQAERLRKEIERATFLDEQHAKNMKDLEYKAPLVEVDTEDTSHLTGEAAVGTDGSTPDTPEMSAHLKRILRLR
jgi:chromosome segregation ATPase